FPLPGAQQPYGHLLRTADGVSKLRMMMATTLEAMPDSVEDTDDQFWESFRGGAQDLASALPEFAKFVTAEATDESVTAWRGTVTRASARLGLRGVPLRKQEQTRCATPPDRSRGPRGHPLRLLVRHASRSDRQRDTLRG